MKMGIQKNASSKVSRKFFGLYPPIVTFWGYISHKWSQKIFQMNLFGGKTAVWGPLPGYITVAMLNLVCYIWLNLMLITYACWNTFFVFYRTVAVLYGSLLFLCAVHSFDNNGDVCVINKCHGIVGQDWRFQMPANTLIHINLGQVVHISLSST